MRRTPSTDMITSTIAQGATAQPGFAQAYRDLAAARAAYDAAQGKPDEVPALAAASARLADARRVMATAQMAA